MKLLSKPMLFALVTMSLTACQSDPYPVTTIATEDLVTKEAESDIYQPILISGFDKLTEGTWEQIEDHNNIYFCRHVTKRPLGFDAGVCK